MTVNHNHLLLLHMFFHDLTLLLLMGTHDNQCYLYPYFVIFFYMCVYVYVCVYMYVCVYIGVCVYIYACLYRFSIYFLSFVNNYLNKTSLLLCNTISYL